MCTMTVGHCSNYTAGDLGDVVSPPVSPGKSPGGGAGGQAPDALRISHFTVPGKRLKTGQKTLSYYGALLPVL